MTHKADWTDAEFARIQKRLEAAPAECPLCTGWGCGALVVRKDGPPTPHGLNVDYTCHGCGATWQVFYQGEAVQLLYLPSRDTGQGAP